MLRTLFNLPKSISYEQILLQYNLDSIKQRRLVQALTFVYKGYPSYTSSMFRIKNCAYNLRSIGSRLDQRAPNTSSKHRSFSYFACRLWNNLRSHVREAPNLKNFLSQLKKVKLSQDLWFLLWLDFIVADSINSFNLFYWFLVFFTFSQLIAIVDTRTFL